MLHLVFSSLLFPVIQSSSNTLVVKRQSYYICGVTPFQYYSSVPCNNQQTCANGGRRLGIGCYYDYQCTPYGGRCINNCCCTEPTAPPTLNSLGFCPSGQRSQATCTTNAGCANGQTCNNGLCCTTTGQEYNNACGGLGGLAPCGANGQCGSFICSTSNYCCECQFGRSAGLCSTGCPAGYTCSSNGYCCSTCSNGQRPFGVCQNGQCPTGFSCIAGNVCCRI